MDRIIEDLFIGNYLDALDSKALESAGVRSVLSLDGTLKDADYSIHGVREIVVVELIDGAGNRPEVFLRAVRELARLRKNSAPVLIQCHAGQSRSAIVTARHLMAEEGMSLAHAMELISERREVKVTPGLQEVLDF